jgi:hypothetical protein
LPSPCSAEQCSALTFHCAVMPFCSLPWTAIPSLL